MGGEKGPYTELYLAESMKEIYSRFFGAVSLFQEPNGSGNIMIWKNNDNKTIRFDGHYGNYENRDCSNRISAYLGFPGFYMPGIEVESKDMFNYSLEKIECPTSELGIVDIVSELNRVLPNASITGQTVRDDFCSIQFRT